MYFAFSYFILLSVNYGQLFSNYSSSVGRVIMDTWQRLIIQLRFFDYIVSLTFDRNTGRNGNEERKMEEASIKV